MTTITSIILALILGAFIVLSTRLSNESKRKDSDIKSLKRQKSDLEKEVYDSRCALFSARETNIRLRQNMVRCADHYYPFDIGDGTAKVLRACVVDGVRYNTVIKHFTDPDPDFNLREARELCDLLNSK